MQDKITNDLAEGQPQENTKISLCADILMEVILTKQLPT